MTSATFLFLVPKRTATEREHVLHVASGRVFPHGLASLSGKADVFASMLKRFFGSC